MFWTMERMERRILNREAKKHPPPLHSHPKYTMPFSISRRFESPLKIHWKTLFECLHSDFWRITTRIMEYSNAFKNSFHRTRLFPSRRTRIGFETCLRHRQTHPRYWQPALRIPGTSRKKGRATLLASSLGCKIRPREGRGICIQSATLRWYLNHGDGRDEWRCLFFPSLLRVSVPVDTLCTRYSKKYNAWMHLWKRRR